MLVHIVYDKVKNKLKMSKYTAFTTLLNDFYYSNNVLGKGFYEWLYNSDARPIKDNYIVLFGKWIIPQGKWPTID